jgi:hypothetical protein
MPRLRRRHAITTFIRKPFAYDGDVVPIIGPLEAVSWVVLTVYRISDQSRLEIFGS